MNEKNLLYYLILTWYIQSEKLYDKHNLFLWNSLIALKISFKHFKYLWYL